MKELFAVIRERLQKKEPLVLATVTGSSGSTPRGAGARMLVGRGPGPAGTRLWGSTGGGVSESLAVTEAGTLLQSGRGVSFKKYALHSGGAVEPEAVCGGEISVFFRLLSAGEPGLIALVEKACECFSGGNAAWLVMEIPRAESSGAESLSARAADFFLGIAGEGGLLTPWDGGPRDTGPLLKNYPIRLEEGGKIWFSEALFAGGFVYIFGGGHVARELVPLLAHLGFRCVVIDDREEFSSPGLFPSAEKTILGNFERLCDYVNLTEKDYAVIVTRGHEWDFEAWAFALESPAAYIGVIGSKTKHAFLRERLRGRGFTGDEISASRVHTPIGIAIKSETPQEIAVSIAGELILARARLRGS